MVEVDQDEINILEDQIQNITAIISNMSELIDAETTKGEVSLEEVEINQLIRKIMAGLKPQYTKKGVSLNLLTGEKLILTTDRYMLSQAIYNIMTNAYKYTDEGGKVEIRYGMDDGRLGIEISDTGIGISDRDKEKIFNAYYSAEVDGIMVGEGIGLYVAAENLKQLGGRISVQSQIGKGSRFIIELPLDKGRG
jgi:signal transduction histidine kinase